jgi:hypothetical protein
MNLHNHCFSEAVARTHTEDGNGWRNNQSRNRANIDQVIVDGRVLIDAGRYIHGDETAMISAANAAIGKIWDLPEAQAAFNG